MWFNHSWMATILNFQNGDSFKSPRSSCSMEPQYGASGAVTQQEQLDLLKNGYHRTAMTEISNQLPRMSHQHLKPLWRWSGVSAKETVHRIVFRTSLRTCHARTYAFATLSAKMSLTCITDSDDDSDTCDWSSLLLVLHTFSSLPAIYYWLLYLGLLDYLFTIY